ncbi:hypothetical protein BGX26_012347 [Mortierella sp. AD094]|nr:hypothetical protein BGX26_012347 [Mortierella sp. AD094]
MPPVQRTTRAQAKVARRQEMIESGELVLDPVQENAADGITLDAEENPKKRKGEEMKEKQVKEKKVKGEKEKEEKVRKYLGNSRTTEWRKKKKRLQELGIDTPMRGVKLDENGQLDAETVLKNKPKNVIESYAKHIAIIDKQLKDKDQVMEAKPRAKLEVILEFFRLRNSGYGDLASGYQLCLLYGKKTEWAHSVVKWSKKWESENLAAIVPIQELQELENFNKLAKLLPPSNPDSTSNPDNTSNSDNPN